MKNIHFFSKAIETKLFIPCNQLWSRRAFRNVVVFVSIASNAAEAVPFVNDIVYALHQNVSRRGGSPGRCCDAGGASLAVERDFATHVHPGAHCQGCKLTAATAT